jgi:gamma-glutamylcyclotransferase (GGCT)/AIG2-like uncharacterized protein YtfP
MRLAVNGTLMRGFDLNPQMLEAGGGFISEAFTAPIYRLWSIRDAHPGMTRDDQRGAAIALELWELSAGGILQVLNGEQEGLCLGKVTLADGQVVLGILAEANILEGCQEITHFGGWRKYLQSK